MKFESLPISIKEISKHDFFKLAESQVLDPHNLVSGNTLDIYSFDKYDYLFVLDEEEFQHIQDQINCPEYDITIAYFDHSVDPEAAVRGEIIVTHMAFYINKSAFIIDGKDYTQCIPIVLRHEVTELYYKMITDEEPADGYRHQKAIEHEMLLSYRLGLQDMYLELALKWAERSSRRDAMRKEHIDAYNNIAGRLNSLNRNQDFPLYYPSEETLLQRVS